MKNMLMVKTRLGISKIHGIGLFADQDIKKGTTTWRFMPGLDLVVPEHILLQLSEAARAQFLNYCYVDKFTKHFILCFDDERFINHSKKPNIIQSKAGNEIEGIEIAAVNIKKGEELLCDYKQFDFDSYRKLNKLDIYTYTIENEKEREAQVENFISKLFKVNGHAAKEFKLHKNISRVKVKK